MSATFDKSQQRLMTNQRRLALTSMNSRLAAIGVTAAVFSGLFAASAGVAYADASSTVERYYKTSTLCYDGQASTITGVGGRMQTWSRGNLCAGNVARDIGGSAYLKKTSGAICSTASATYLNGTYHLRSAIYSNAACGAGSFAGGGTSYGYTGSGYASKSIMAPYQAF